MDGHKELSDRQAKLDAERAEGGRRHARRPRYDEGRRRLRERKNEVYDKTDELRQATDRTSPNTVSDPGDGAAAGCGSSGAFVECRAVTAGPHDDDSERTSGDTGDRCVALAGVSSGCGVSAGSGDSEAKASCNLTGADQGCSSSSRKGTGDDAVVANAWMGLGKGDGGQSTRATSDGAAMVCESGNGCRGDTTGPTRTGDGTAAVPGERSAQKASCTGKCGVDGLADTAGCRGRLPHRRRHVRGIEHRSRVRQVR